MVTDSVLNHQMSQMYVANKILWVYPSWEGATVECDSIPNNQMHCA